MKFEIFVELDTFCHFLEKKGFIMKLWLGITYSSFPPPPLPSFNQIPKGQNQVSALLLR